MILILYADPNSLASSQGNGSGVNDETLSLMQTLFINGPSSVFVLYKVSVLKLPTNRSKLKPQTFTSPHLADNPPPARPHYLQRRSLETLPRFLNMFPRSWLCEQ